MVLNEALSNSTNAAAMQVDAHMDLLVTDVGPAGGMNGRRVADAGRGHAMERVLGHFW